MTATAALESTVIRMESTSHHVAALLAALAPDPSKWEYRGECGEDTSGRALCACGHPIRYLFPVYLAVDGQPERSAILGSTCIDHYAAINPEAARRMAEAYQAKLAELAAAKAAARAVKQQAEVQAAYDRHAALRQQAYDRYETYRVRGLMAPRALWQAVGSRKCYVPGPDACPDYQRPCAARKWHNKQIAALEYALQEVAS